MIRTRTSFFDYDQSMRKLVKAVVAVLLAASALSGCAFSDPRIEGLPPAGSSTAASFTGEADDVHAAWEAVSGLAGLDPDNQQFKDMSATLASQWLVLTGPDPYHRLSAVGADIGTPSPISDLGEGTASADTALTSARDNALSQANASTGLETAFWAGLAAGLEQVRLGLTGTYGAAIPPDPTVTITMLDEPTALSDLISRYDEGIFAMRSAMGFLDPADPDQSSFQTVLSSLRTDRANLAGLAASAEATPTSQGIYELPPGRDHAAAMVLLAATQKALTQASVAWAACASDPTQATPYVMSNATLAMGYGLGTAAWPGWPD